MPQNIKICDICGICVRLSLRCPPFAVSGCTQKSQRYADNKDGTFLVIIID